MNIESLAVTLNAKHLDTLIAYNVSVGKSVYRSALEAYKTRVSRSDSSLVRFKFKKFLLGLLKARYVAKRGERLDLFNESTLK